MIIVGIVERPAERLRQRASHGGLAGARHPHQYDDHRGRPFFFHDNGKPRCYRNAVERAIATRVASAAAEMISPPPMSVRRFGISPSRSAASTMP